MSSPKPKTGLDLLEGYDLAVTAFYCAYRTTPAFPLHSRIPGQRFARVIPHAIRNVKLRGEKDSIQTQRRPNANNLITRYFCSGESGKKRREGSTHGPGRVSIESAFVHSMLHRTRTHRVVLLFLHPWYLAPAAPGRPENGSIV